MHRRAQALEAAMVEIKNERLRIVPQGELEHELVQIPRTDQGRRGQGLPLARRRRALHLI